MKFSLIYIRPTTLLRGLRNPDKPYLGPIKSFQNLTHTSRGGEKARQLLLGNARRHLGCKDTQASRKSIVCWLGSQVSRDTPRINF